MLRGVVIRQIKRSNDERGFFSEIMRQDWEETLQNDKIVQANLSLTYPGIIRAWHKHLRGQTDYFVVLKGALKICIYDKETEELVEVVSTGQDLQVVRIPGIFWHGFKSVSNETAWLLYFTTSLYDYVNPDEERRPWNDQTVIPKSINGNRNDPRASKPWNWNYTPNK